MTAHELPPPPFTRVYDLSDLGAGGAELTLEAGPHDLVKLAEWLDVAEAKSFTATIRLKRQGQEHFLYDAKLTADLIQACVVTLAPVPAHHAFDVHRVLHLLPRRRRGESGPAAGELTLAAGGEDVPEELETSRFDLAAPLLEELTLALEPYPRAQGVEFSPPELPGEEKPNPFAVLAKLKDR